MWNTGGLVRIATIRDTLRNGGVVKFYWSRCHAVLEHGETFTTIDGRSYQAFLKTADNLYVKTTSGSVDTRDLIIEWRKK